MRKAILVLFGVFLSCYAYASTGPYVSTINTLQVLDIGHSYTTVHLTKDVTDSPCSSTNQFNRFTITSNAQLSLILAALMANKTIRVYGTGACNSVNIENISDVRVSP